MTIHHQQFLRKQTHIELECEQNTTLLKKPKMWFSQESNLALHIKKSDVGIFFSHTSVITGLLYFFACGTGKIHVQTLCSGQRNYQEKFTVDIWREEEMICIFVAVFYITREYASRLPLRAFGGHRVRFFEFLAIITSN